MGNEGVRAAPSFHHQKWPTMTMGLWKLSPHESLDLELKMSQFIPFPCSGYLSKDYTTETKDF